MCRSIQKALGHAASIVKDVCHLANRLVVCLRDACRWVSRKFQAVPRIRSVAQTALPTVREERDYRTQEQQLIDHIITYGMKRTDPAEQAVETLGKIREIAFMGICIDQRSYVEYRVYWQRIEENVQMTEANCQHIIEEHPYMENALDFVIMTMTSLPIINFPSVIARELLRRIDTLRERLVHPPFSEEVRLFHNTRNIIVALKRVGETLESSLKLHRDGCVARADEVVKVVGIFPRGVALLIVSY